MTERYFWMRGNIGDENKEGEKEEKEEGVEIGVVMEERREKDRQRDMQYKEKKWDEERDRSEGGLREM